VPPLLVAPSQQALLRIRSDLGQGENLNALEIIKFLRELRLQEVQLLQVALAIRAEKRGRQ
jgi:hypothetical protein